MKNYRVVLSIRARGQTPFDQKEKLSENYEDIEEFAEACKQFVLDNVYDDQENEEGEDENNESA